MAVIDIARTTVVTVKPGEVVADVIRQMHQDTVGSVVVVDETDILGLVNERDLVLAVLDEDFDAENTCIEETLSDETVTIASDAGIYELVELFSRKGIRRVPVVDDGELAGIVSLSDVVVLLGMELQHVATAIRSSSPAYERSSAEFYPD